MPIYQGQLFSCVNPRGRFHTDISGKRGFKHLPDSETFGSALEAPLVRNSDGGTLWLEHVVDENDGDWEPLWFMWYNADGTLRLAASGVFDASHLSKVGVEALIGFLRGQGNA